MNKLKLLTRVVSMILCMVFCQITYAQKASPKSLAQPQSVSNAFDVKKKNTLQEHIPITKYPKINGPQSLLQTPTPYQSISPAFSAALIREAPYQLREVHLSKENGLPIFIRTQDAAPSRASLQSQEDVGLATFVHLESLQDLMRIDQPTDEFEVERIDRDDLGHIHVKLQQIYKGIPLYGSEAYVHFDPAGDMLLNGRYVATPKLQDLMPNLSESDAIEISLAAVGKETYLRSLNEKEKELLKYERPIVELIIYPVEGYIRTHRLAYHLTVRPNFIERWEYFIDAQNGDILNSYNHTCTLVPPTTTTGTHLNGSQQSIGTFQLSNGQYILLNASKSMYKGAAGADPQNGDGFILTADMQNTNPQNDPKFEEIFSNNNTWSSLQVSAHANASIAYDYFENTFGWQSINGQGGDIISFINVADENGGGFDNAFWNGAAMFYGNGDRAFSPLAGAIDVGGHEMAHGIIQATANLEYQGESGSLNESYADIFGSMIDREDWLLGEDIVNTNIYRSGALRNMENPNNGGSSFSDNGYQPDHYSQRFQGPQTPGGVHINSGINNRAYVLTANVIGKSKAEQIFFRALRFYLTRSSQFIDMRLAAIQAAGDLYGNTEINALRNAYDQVGIIGDQGTPPPTDVEVNPGDDFLISTDVNDGDPNTLYRSDTQGSNNSFVALSQTKHKRPISITDNGQVGYFVGEDSHIRGIFTDPNLQPNETIVSDQPSWDNVAISKDGNRLAAISTSIDTSIYVFNLENGTGVKYVLYTPTTAEGVQTGDVLYADAIEWDFNGEVLLYDAFNRIPNPDGDDIEYWDVGFINVWDNAANNFGNGAISTLFTNLPEGVSVGNPSFSKNSPFIITFDFFDVNDPSDENDDEILLMAANIETGDVGALFQNSVLGFPSYSRLDDKIVFSATDTEGGEIVAQLQLGADKISPIPNSAAALIGVAKWPEWYSVGERITTSIDVKLADQFGLVVYPNPFQDKLNIEFEVEKRTNIQLALFDLLGHKVQQLPVSSNTLAAGQHKFEFSMSSIAAGTYMLKVAIGNTSSYVKVVRY